MTSEVYDCDSVKLVLSGNQFSVATLSSQTLRWLLLLKSVTSASINTVVNRKQITDKVNTLTLFILKGSVDQPGCAVTVWVDGRIDIHVAKTLNTQWWLQVMEACRAHANVCSGYAKLKFKSHRLGQTSNQRRLVTGL